MITGLFFTFIGSVATWVVGLLPTLPDASSAIGGIASGMATLMSYAASMGAWIPWATVGICLAIILPCILGAVAIHFVRLTYSMFTGGGGAT